ncbi:MAG TPA: hypothetical protein VN771_01455 [Candidatus Baltobacteraceae bacterium]|nr:hypothetical protein [Candidatus Baltobacteraceae bacterium]
MSAARCAGLPFLTAILALGLVAGCASTPVPSPSPSGPWHVASVGVTGTLSQIPAGLTIGDFCSPCDSTDESELVAVATGTAGLVGVGVTTPGPQAAIWQSSDGQAWQPASGFASPPQSALLGVVDGPRGWVAVGTVGRAGAAWQSSDGATWTAATTGLTTPGTVHLSAVSTTQTGYLAGGAVIDQAGATAATVWGSADGRTWTAQALPGGSGAEIHGLASAGTTTVAVGWATEAGIDRAVAWWTADGRTWQRIPLDPAAGTRAQAVAHTDAGWVTVGSRADQTMAAAWTSPDGRTWSPAHSIEGSQVAGGGEIQMLAVAPAGPGVVAVGWRDSSGNGNGTAWSSADGTVWQRLPDADSFSGAILSGVTVAGTQEVVVGAVGRPDNPSATVWLAASDIGGPTAGP